MATTEAPKRSNRPDYDVKEVMLNNIKLSGVAFILLLTLFVLVTTDVVKLGPQGLQAESLKEFPKRVEYAFRYQTLLVFWLLFNILATIYGRLMNRAINPLDESTEEHVQLHKNILTNSYESIVLSVFAQLGFVCFAHPATVLRYIPMINIVHLIGRIAFFIGYPFYRGFGYHLTIVPTVVLVGYNVYKCLGFMFTGEI